MKPKAISKLGGVLALLVVPALQAEQSVTVGDYTIHYNALPTTSLTAEIARSYGIKRSGSRALLNVSVVRADSDAAAPSAVEADINASATNLSAQRRDVELRKVQEGPAIYYIGTVTFANQETLKFTVSVAAEGMAEPTVVNFSQQFFTD